MRIGYAVAVAALLASTSAMAQITIGGGDPNDAQRHEWRANQDRGEGRQEMNDARQQAAMGNYGAAAQDQQAARQDWHAAHDQQRDAQRDDNGGVSVQFGH